jgi:hypothetical protein
MDTDSTPTYTPSASTVGESRYVFVTHEYRVSLDFLGCDMQRHYQNRTDNPSGQHPANSFPTKDGTGVIEASDVLQVIRRFAAAVSAARHPSWPRVSRWMAPALMVDGKPPSKATSTGVSRETRTTTPSATSFCLPTRALPAARVDHRVQDRLISPKQRNVIETQNVWNEPG